MRGSPFGGSGSVTRVMAEHAVTGTARPFPATHPVDFAVAIARFFCVIGVAFHACTVGLFANGKAALCQNFLLEDQPGFAADSTPRASPERSTGVDIQREAARFVWVIHPHHPRMSGGRAWEGRDRKAKECR